MTPTRLIAGLFAAAALAAGGMSHADPVAGHLILAANDFSGQNYAVGGAQTATLEFDHRAARWGLKLGVEQHIDRGVQLKDLQPGLFYRVTPRLHIGGAVSLAPEEVEGQSLINPRLPAPRVRLETTFKF